MTQIKKDVVTWLKQWFPLKGTETRSLSEIVTSLTGSITNLENNKVDKNQGTANKNVVTDSSGAIGLGDKNDHAHGSINKSGQVNSDISSVNKVVVTDTLNNVKTISKLPADKVTHQSITGKADKTGGVAQVTDANASNYTSIGSLSNGATQQAINNAINSKLYSILSRVTQLEGVEFVKIVSSLPDIAEAEGNKLYVVTGGADSDGDDFGIYVLWADAEHPNGAWERVDDAILKGFLTESDADSIYARLNHSHTVGDISLPSSNVNWTNLGRSTAQVNTLYLLLNNLNTIVGNLSTKSETVGVTITLVDKGQTDEGCIIFNTVG